MRISKRVLFFFCQAALILSNNAYPQQGAPLFWLGNEPHFSDEFLYAFNKNRQATNAGFSENELKEYFDLYVKFRLKVKEAKAQGYDKKPAFVSEMAGYKKQLAKPYLVQSIVNEALVAEAYSRTLEEIEASHILIELPERATPDDTLGAYNKLLSLKKMAESGESFASLAKQYSHDPSAKQNDGYLGFFGAFQMVYPFESAAFNTPVGQVSDPFRTTFGYHIVKVHSQRASLGSVKLAHIFFKNTSGDSALAFSKAIEVKSRLEQGEEWRGLVAQYSEELSNKNQGGELPWLSFRQLPATFYEAAASLQAGEIAGPVKAQNGWHLIRLIERKPVPPLDEVRNMIEARISSDGRAAGSNNKTIDSLIAKLGATVDDQLADKALSQIDGRLVEAKWSYEPTGSLLAEGVIHARDTTITIGDLYAYIEINQKKRNDLSVEGYAGQLWKQFLFESLEDLELKRLHQTNADYRHLYHEYYDGTLLFEIMNDKVWQLANTDTVGLQSFFDKNSQRYMWQERAEIVVVEGKNETLQGLLSGSLDSLLLIEKHVAGESIETEVMLKEAASTFENLDISLDSLVLVVTGNTAFAQQVSSFDFGRHKPSIKTANSASENILEWFSASKSSLEKYFNSIDTLSLRFSSQVVEKNEGKLADQYWKKGVHFIEDGAFSRVVVVRRVMTPQPKALHEIKGKVVSDYQNFLESQWMRTLAEKYPLKINSKEWKSVEKKLNEK